MVYQTAPFSMTLTPNTRVRVRVMVRVGCRNGRSTCDQVAALTTFIENGFQQNLKTRVRVRVMVRVGCRNGRSTCDQVAALTTFIENGFQQNLKTGAVFLDLTAAYDTVWHTGLLYKLSKSMPYWFTDWWVCCFEINVSGCTCAMTSAWRQSLEEGRYVGT